MTLAVSSRPQTTELHRFVTQVPRTIADQESRKASLYNLALKVSLVAIVALAATFIGITFGLITPFHPLLSFGLILSTFLITGLQSLMMARSSDCSDRAIEAAEIAKELDRIRHWQKPQIEAFFKEHTLSLDKLPMDLLRKLDPKEPLRALLPAIATYIRLCKRAQNEYKEHEENLYRVDNDRRLQLEYRKLGWENLEFKALPAALQAAHALQIIAQPTLSLQLTDIGTFKPKEFDERRFDQILDGRDEYFIFKNPKQPPLNFAEAHELVAKQNFDGLRLKLFPSAGALPKPTKGPKVL